MLRVLRVMVILATLSLVVAVAAQPARASLPDVPDPQDHSQVEQNDGSDVYDNTGGPNDGGEGDPDSVGGGYGARAGDSIIGGFLSGLLGFDGEEMTFEEYIYLMMLQFMPTP